MTKKNEILKVRRTELAALLRKTSPSFKACKFKVVHNKKCELIEIFSENNTLGFIGFDMIEPLQMFCHMYSLLWMIMPNREYGIKLAVHADNIVVDDN